MTSKQNLRTAARAIRAKLADTVPDFAARLAGHAATLDIPPNTLIGAYIALPGEADPAALIAQLARAGCRIAVPRVAAKDMPLIFHHWAPGQVLVPGAYNIPEPAAHWPVVHPEILLVPLLAFDSTGHRLGYGGGFYDRTLAQAGNVRTIGIAYAGQEVAHLPHQAHDRRLDMIATEQGVRRFHHT